MRLLYACHQFFPEYYTGTERYTLDLAKQSQKLGHQVTVLTYSHHRVEGLTPIDIQGLQRGNYEYEGVPVVTWRHSGRYPTGEEPELYFRLKDAVLKEDFRCYLEEHPFDILHCTHPMRIGPILEVAQERSLGIVLHLTDYWMICPRVMLLRPNGTLCDGPAKGENCAKYCYPTVWPQQMLDRFRMGLRTLALADVVISPSKFLIDTFKRAGVDTQRFIYRPHGYEYGKVRFTKQGQLSGQEVTFGFFGTILPHKGVNILIDAFMKVRSNRIRLKVYGGHFREFESYQDLVNRAGRDSRIEFCGEYDFDQVGSILRNIDVVVVPSLWYENAPLVISTAYAFGIPVIATGIGGMAEMVNGTSGGPAGLTFRLGESNDLAKKIRRIAAKPEILTELSRNITPPPRIESDAFFFETVYKSLKAGEPVQV